MTTHQPHEAIAAEIRAEMARRKVSQVKIAALLDISQVGVSRRLRGETPLDVNELVKIADYLGVPITHLMPQDGVA